MISKEQQNQFIQSQLNQYGIDVIEEMRKEIKRLDIEDSTELLKSLSHKVLSDNSLELMMREHGAFVDMGSGRGYSHGKKITNQDRKVSYKIRKPKKFYSPIAYKQISTLIGRISYGYAQDILRELKNELQNTTT